MTGDELQVMEVNISNNKIKTHKDLDVWKSSIDFVVKIYELTKKFPSFELYGLSLRSEEHQFQFRQI